MLSERDIQATGIPLRTFFYTIDQLAVMLNISEAALMKSHIFTEREPGYQPKWKMRAVNIATPHDRPDWRVADKELIRWLKFKGFRIIERGYTQK